MTGAPPDPDPPGADEEEPPPVPVSSPRTRRVVLGIAVAVLVLIGGGLLVLALSGGEEDGEDAGGLPGVPGAPGAGPSAGVPVPSGAAPPGPVPSAGGLPGPSGTPAGPPGVPPGSTFAPAPGLCEEADFSPVFDLLPATDVLTDDEFAGPTIYQRTCVFELGESTSRGTFTLDASVYSGAEEAGSWFEEVLAAEARDQEHREVSGDWDETALLVLPGEAGEQADVRFMARDDALVLNLWTFVVGGAADPAALEDALLEIAGQVRDTMRE